jgi:hypothetical protein
MVRTNLSGLVFGAWAPGHHGSPRRGAGGRDALIEALNLAPAFLENLVFEQSFRCLVRGVIRVEPFCQIALERSIPEVADILTTTSVLLVLAVASSNSASAIQSSS